MNLAACIGGSGKDRLAPIALTLAALFWSGNFVAGRAIRDDIDPITLNTVRWSLALVLFLPFAWRSCLNNAAEMFRHWRYLIALGATGIAAFHTTVYLALTQTTAVNALLILALAPVAILSGSALLGGAVPTRTQWAGCVLSLLGAVILVTRGDFEILRELSSRRGDLWMLAAIIVWAAYSLLLKRRPPALPPNVVLAGSMATGVAIMAPVFLAYLPMAHATVSGGLIGAVSYIVLFPSVVAFWLWSYGVGQIGPERAGPFLNLMPVFGSFFAMVILGEQIESVQVVGGVVILLGIMIMRRESRR